MAIKKSEVINKYVKSILGTYKTKNNSLVAVDGIILKSYDTIIAYNDGNRFLITNKKYSKTTTTHINELKRCLKETKQKYKEVDDVSLYI